MFFFDVILSNRFNSFMFQAVVLCQVERAKDAMLNQLYSSIRYKLDEFGKQCLTCFDVLDCYLLSARYCRQFVFISICVIVRMERGESKSYCKRTKR